MTYDFQTLHDRTGTESGKWHRYAPDVLPMHVADMDFRSPPEVIAALHERVEHGFFGYGREEPAFFDVVVDRLKRRYGWEVSAESVFLTPGVIAGFNLAVKAFTQPGDSILVQTPAYGPILHCNENHQVGRDDAPMAQSEDGRYEVDWEAFEGAFRPSTKVFLSCNPHNPTGRVFTRTELERMGQMCVERDLLICSDEIHCDLVHRGHTHTPIAAINPEIAKRTVTLMAPSKTFNLPGLKCAIAIVTNPELRERIEGARQGLVRATNILGYVATLAAYRDGDAWLAEMLGELEGNRQFVADYVRRNLAPLRCLPPEGTYLAWLDCRDLGVDDPAAFFLEQAKVGLNDGITFGELGKGFVRLNFACPRSMLTEALERMRGAVETLGSAAAS